jgi:putative hemolysin
MKTKTLFFVFCLLVSSCTKISSQPTEVVVPETPTTQPTMSTLPNPASVFCQQQGYTLEIRTADDGSQTGVCVFSDGSECDEWAYYRAECAPSTANVDIPTATSIPISTVPTPIPTAVPIDASYYQGFWTYTHPEYGFSIMLPGDWVVDETTTGDPIMNDHILIFHPQPTPDIYPTLRMSFRSIGEEVLLWPTGVGQGEFIPQGTLNVAGQPAGRIYFVCPNGLINAIWYQGGENEPNIQRSNMEFGFIYSYTGTSCQEPYSLTGKVQLVGEMIIASLQVP